MLKHLPYFYLPAALCCMSLIAQSQQPVPADLVPVPGITWTRFTDPNEHAFSVDVPQGWKIDGGLARRTGIDTSDFLRALSPDGSIVLIMGDPDLPAMQHTPGFGAGPGSKPYLPGKELARSYAESSLPALCSGLTLESSADRDDIAAGPLAKAVPGSRYDAGEAFYACTHNGKPERAYMVAGTYIYHGYTPSLPSIWGFNLLDGCIAPADRIDTARKILLHMLLSARNDPEWVRQQQARVDQATRGLNVLTAAQAQAAESQRANFRQQMAVMTHQYNAFSEVQTQTGTFIDPSGQRYVLSNTKSYHWVSTGGKTAETDSPTPPPGGGWTQLKQVPAQ
jgi:hypothetical protein